MTRAVGSVVMAVTAALALGACQPAAEQAPAGAAGAPTGTGAAAPPATVLAAPGELPIEGLVAYAPIRTGLLTDWVQFARGADQASVAYAPATRGVAPDGTRVVWVQIQHMSDQLWEGETKRFYRLERARYQFRCDNRTFTIRERQILEGEGRNVADVEVVEKWAAEGAAAEFAPVGSGGSAAVLFDIICPRPRPT